MNTLDPRRVMGWLRAHPETAVALALILLTLLLRLPFLEQPFDNNSGANAYYAREILRGNPLYGTHHPGHHMPALYYLYAATFALLGVGVWPIKLLLIPWTLATAYLLYRLARTVYDRPVGWLAALFYIVLSSHIDLFGATGQRELFANLPRIAVVWLLARQLTSPPTGRRWFAIGILSTLTFLFKATYVSGFLLAGFALLVLAWRERRHAGAARRLFSRGVAITAGVIATLGPVIAYFAAAGVLDRFLLVFSLGQGYITTINAIPAVGDQTWLLYILFPLLGLGLNNGALLIFALAAVAVIAVSRPQHTAVAALLIAWFALSFVEGGLNRRYFLHYYLLIVPPLALLAAWFPLQLTRALHAHSVQHSSKRSFNSVGRTAPPFESAFLRKERGGPRPLFGRALLLLLTAIPLLISVRANVFYYQHYVNYRLGYSTRDQWLTDGAPATGPKLVQLAKVADYVAAHTTADDHIYYWSFDFQLYFMTDRLAATDILGPPYVGATGPVSRVYAPTTTLIIVDEGTNLRQPEWLYPALETYYTLETRIEDQAVYRRRPAPISDGS